MLNVDCVILGLIFVVIMLIVRVVDIGFFEIIVSFYIVCIGDFEIIKDL